MDALHRLLGHAYRLKITLLLLVACWMLLIIEFPGEGEGPVPRWWTAIYALAKVGIGVCVAHVTIEVFPFVRLTDLLADYQRARQARNGTMALAAAVAFVGSTLAVAVVMATIIYAMAVW